MKLDQAYRLLDCPLVEEGLEVENILETKAFTNHLNNNDGSSLYRFLWHFIIYKTNLAKEELKVLEDTCNAHNIFAIVLFNLILDIADSTFKVGYINTDLRNSYDFLYKPKGEEAEPSERNYIQAPQDEMPCRINNHSFVMTARSVNELGIEKLEQMQDDAENSSPIKDPIKLIRKEDFIDHFISECKQLNNPMMRVAFLKAVELPEVEDITTKILHSALDFSSSKRYPNNIELNSEKGIPARICDGEFVFSPKATITIGAENLSRMMADANQRARSKENVRAYGS